MRAPAPGEHEGLTGVTFDSGGHRLVGTLYLARGGAPKPTVLLLHGCWHRDGLRELVAGWLDEVESH